MSETRRRPGLGLRIRLRSSSPRHAAGESAPETRSLDYPEADEVLGFRDNNSGDSGHAVETSLT
jgi:hypothetical protein